MNRKADVMQNEYLAPLWEALDTFAAYPAIVDQNGIRVTTYAELKEYACRVIAWLKAQNLPEHAFVPVLLESSMEYIACEIGLWMSGHAAVPMGPSYPEERVSYICGHCEAPFVLDAQVLQQIHDMPAAELSGMPDYPPEDIPALLVYTSGSTGMPKGILHTFGGLAQKHTSKVGLAYTTEDAWAMGAPLYFVASLTAYKVLKEGASLHLISPATYRDIRAFEDYVVEHGITYTFLSPSMLANFHNRSKSLKLVFTGSEKLTGQASRDGYKLMNCYGMTETAGTVTGFLVKEPYELTPVGKPEEEWCLLDEDGNPVGEGEEGEFCLRGHYCEGYYKDPERNAELYRGGWLHTGDLMRQLPDGNLVYVNRKDWMAKINGQRVEPGEVERAIKRLGGVSEAVVKAFDKDDGSQYLCAFFVGDADADALREELARTLPPYMVPSYFLRVHEFSLLPNGKVNRKVLAAPDLSELKTDYVAPETPLEERLCGGFAKVFGMDQVGVLDDFFLLGGDSIRVMKLQADLEDLPLSTKLITQCRTPRKIAAELEDKGLVAPFEPKPFPASAPLTQTQLGIYAQSMARRGEAVYNNPVLLRLGDGIEPERLARALETAVEAHAFVKLHIEEAEDGTPVMVPGAEACHVTVERLTNDELETTKETLVAPFDLQKGPLYRLRVFQTPTATYLFSDFHHIIYDGTSARVFMADVDAAYAGKMPEPERYTGFDLSAAEAEARAGDAYADARAFYEQTFGGLDLTSVPMPDVHASADVEFAELDVSLGLTKAALNAFCVRSGITQNVAAIAAFGRTLATFTNAREALFATIYNGRADLLTARTVDMMVKTLPVYVRWGEDTRVSDYLRAVKEQVMGSMSNDLYSFAEASALCGVTSDVLFAYQGDYLDLGTVCGESYRRVELTSNATGSPLDFQVFAVGDDLVLHVEYQSNLYSERFVASFARAFGNVLRDLLCAERVDELSLLTLEQAAELDAFFGDDVDYDDTQTVVSLYDAAAETYAHNVAVVCGDDQLTYAELAELSDRLAGRLTEAGLGAGDVVSVLIPRGLWMPVSALGALKAGCAYQPLDPTYPPERLSFMVSDAQAKMLITTHELRDLVSDYEGSVLAVDDPRALSPAEKPQMLTPPVPDSLLILLYTSGTTGVPKGVRLLHRNLVCFIGWYQRYYGLTAEARVGAYASFGFDACMMDMFPALTCGAAVVIVPEDMRLDLIAMGEYLNKHGVTHAFMTTQVGRQFAINAECPSLEHLSMGGETLVPFDVPERPVCHNGYGPTECTIFSTVYPLEGGETVYPIGHALDNMAAYIVCKGGQRVPVGAAGELWLAGPQIGDGYLNRPEKTAEVFLNNPFSDDERYRNLYRTGDVVRWMPDGKVEFVGRADGQVKIRGFRIELTEVEAVVREFPGIRDATVAAFDHPSGGKFVAAFVVADEPIDVAALDAFIAERKPPYMVPAAVMQLDAIPLNQNGKVNRRALPVPSLVESDDAEGKSTRPANVLERELHAIAAQVLGNDAFGITSSLVRCGLTSIQSIQLLALVYKRFGVSLKPANLGDDVSVASLENLVLAEWMAGHAAVATSTRERREFRAPLTFAQTGVYVECLKFPDSCAYNVPALFRFGSDVLPNKLANAVLEVVAAHPTLFSHFEATDERAVLVGCEGSPEVERVALSDDALGQYARDFVRPFDLVAGPLARFSVVTTETCTAIVADFHHLVFDGSSMDLFLRDLSAALEGKTLEPEAYTYADYAIDEHAFASSSEFEENRAYVGELLKDFETATELSSDTSGSVGGDLGLAVAPFDLALVEKSAADAGVTPAGHMLAAVAYALGRYTNERKLYLSTISSGRYDVRCSDTVGMFVNTLPLAVGITDVSRAEFVRSCADALAAAVAHEAYPFANVAADFGFSPQVMFEYQLGVVGERAIPGLVRVESLEAKTAKFKLTVRIEMHEGGPAVALHYDSALYSASLMEGLARSAAIAAEELATRPSEPVRRVSLLDAARREQLAGFHAEATGPADFTLYHEGLERQAKLKPDACALVAADGSFTFAELNAFANRIAHALVQRGVVRGDRVALLLPRTSRVVMALFGVMKAGAAYIPCDPTYPVERVEHILGDSGSKYVLTTPDKVGEYQNAIDVEDLLCCDDTTNPQVSVTPDDLAYLIYTSGSTGKPKGVMLTHAGVCNFHTNVPSNILVDALVRRAHAFLSVTTLSFDMSVKEVGTPLVNGITVVLASESQTNEPGALAKLFEQTGADAFNATHSRLKQYLELPAFARAIASCKVVLSGGEKYAEGLLPQLQELTADSQATIINTYGPTETTVSSNMADLTSATRITVGRPLYNVWETVVDADGNELPVGVVGELLIGGPGVATGYHNLPEKTAESFVTFEGRRVYRSGDYARWTPEGFVEILGRTDNQIKLRGLRIELGEVEGALASVEGVTSAVVKIARINGVEHLCAYYVANRPLEAADVRECISRSLATYMVPTAYCQLDALPLTPNGKTDLRALPPAELFRSGESVAAANEVEQAFCDIFSKILGLPDVGATDSFFEIGGTSLMAIRISVEAEPLGYTVTYADVFANQTPRALATLVGGAGVEEGRDVEVEDYDYSTIDELLAGNNLRSFVEGEVRPIGNMMLTGAVGYLAIHILREYLEHYDGTAYCLLRGRGNVSAEQRLAQQLFYYFEHDYTPLFGSRIVVVEGDITRELPIAADVPIDTVVNCAAIVKHFSSGTEIEDVNVGGVAKLIDFCLERDASFVQVSTGSTMKAALKPGTTLVGKTNERQLYVGQDLANKYVRSKFLAERLVLEAVATRGLMGKIMRVGNLAPRTSDGEFQINSATNASMGRLKSFSLLECAPYDQLDSTMEFSPIDETARAILLLANTPRACTVFHAFNHHAVYLGDVFAAMGKAGLTVRAVERDEFTRALHAAEEDSTKAEVLTSLLAYARRPTGKPVVVPQASNAYTMQVLYRLGFRWSPTAEEYVEQFLVHLEGLGFFDLEGE